MGSRTLHPVTTAEAYLELLADRGIDVFLGNAGTDFASLVEAFARAEAEGGRAPRPLVIPHEFVAVSMAHGYYAAGGRPAAVMVHVNVGTGMPRRRSSPPRGPTSPSSCPPGARRSPRKGCPAPRPAHPLGAGGFDQAAMLREYVKWDYELRKPAQIEVRGRSRARADAGRAARARVPHAAARGAGRQPRAGHHRSPARRQVAQRALSRSRTHRGGGADPRARRDPLVLVSAAGPIQRAVDGTGRARRGGRDRRGGGGSDLPELPARPRSAPRLQPVGHDEPLAGRGRRRPGVEADVPVVSRARRSRRPAPPIIHLGVDPFFSRYPMRSYPCDVPDRGRRPRPRCPC